MTAFASPPPCSRCISPAHTAGEFCLHRACVGCLLFYCCFKVSSLPPATEHLPSLNTTSCCPDQNSNRSSHGHRKAGIIFPPRISRNPHSRLCTWFRLQLVVFTARGLSSFPGASVTNDQKLGGFNNRSLFSHSLEALSSRSRCPQGHASSSFRCSLTFLVFCGLWSDRSTPISPSILAPSSLCVCLLLFCLS